MVTNPEAICKSLHLLENTKLIKNRQTNCAIDLPMACNIYQSVYKPAVNLMKQNITL